MVTRRELPAVVRRAAELAEVEASADENISEEEVVRIAAELGLPERHVRQALFERPAPEEPLNWLDRHFPRPVIVATRVVPFEPQHARRLLEDYLITHEYLQINRRQGSVTTFEPAKDAISGVARAFTRSSHHQLAKAQRVELEVRSLEPGRSHVRLKADHADKRKGQVIGASVAGTVFVGVPAGAGVAALATIVSTPLVGSDVALAIGGFLGAGACAGVVTAIVASVRSSFRRWRERASDESGAVLDRLERGDELRPPPAPWLRRLQMKFGQL